MQRIIRKFNAIRDFFKFAPIRFLHIEEPSRLLILIDNLKLTHQLNIRYFSSNHQLNQKKNYLVPIKIPNIDALITPDKIISASILTAYRQYKNLHLCFDLSTEAIIDTHYFSNVLFNFHMGLKKLKINPKHVTLICANANIKEFYQSWLQTNHALDYQINLLGYHFYLYEYYWEIKNCQKFQQKNNDSLLKIAVKTINENKIRKKYFLCLNLRPRSHRTAILLHLLDRNFLNKGYVTYFGSEFADHVSVDKKSDHIAFVEKLQSNPRLLAQLDKLQEITPLLLDKDENAIRKDLWDRKPGEVNFLIPEGDKLETSGIDTYFEIVTETWFTDRTNSYITEKTIRPIIRFQPFIHVGAPYLLAYLRKLGFQTFSPFIDERYDAIEDPFVRMEYIFNEIDRLCSLSIEEIHDVYCQLWPRLLHNYHFFKKNMVKIAKDDIKQNILLKVECHPERSEGSPW